MANDKITVEELTKERKFVLNFELEHVFISSLRIFQTILKGARLLKEIEPPRRFVQNSLKERSCPRVVNPCDVRCTCSLSCSYFGLLADDSDAQNRANCNPLKKVSPRPGIEPGSSAWQAEILTTILPRNPRTPAVEFYDRAFRGMCTISKGDQSKVAINTSISGRKGARRRRDRKRRRERAQTKKSGRFSDLNQVVELQVRSYSEE